ncbi:DUF4142 domain-containing protein [Dactylosporangium sp. CS-047395]|uniref:DUF4142 domain-containing protein n=1 Tax=Dactylosporangium sp. CS-047395 TaxID=3239936 RepID=UPI003D9281E1
MRVPFSVKACAAAVVLAAAVAPAPAQAAPGDLSSMDRAFLEGAGHGGAYEVQGGRLAADRAADQGVRSFGQRMVTDHTKAGDKLAALAEDLGASVPKSPDSVQRNIIEIWSGLKGADFDCSYAPAAYADHVATIGLFEREVADGRNAKLMAFARDTLPTLRTHRGMAAMNLDGLACGTGNSNDVPIVHPTPTWTHRPDPRPWPTMGPTHRPTRHPTMRPTHRPTMRPTARPTRHTPTATPSATRTGRPTARPTRYPTVRPTSWPTRRPAMPTMTMTLPTNVP